VLSARVASILCGIAGSIVLSTMTAGATDLYTKAPDAAVLTQAPAVDGLNAKIDALGSSGTFDEGYRWTARAGLFLHGVGSQEMNTYDVNAELLSPRLVLETDQRWRYFVPRLHLGGSTNLSGRTSFAYTGLVWNVPVFTNAFFEGFIGPAIHNGSLPGTPTMAGLGCPYLFHLGISSGYHFTQNLSAVFTLEHLSNGKQLLDTNCGTNVVTPFSNGNQGLNNYGLRIGYSF
jgi:hypothetical protein